MRVCCTLFGCRLRDLPACHRCGAALYDADFVQRGWLEPLLDHVFRLRALFSVGNFRCAECHRLLTLPQMWNEWKRSGELWGLGVIKFCSGECHDHWLPF